MTFALGFALGVLATVWIVWMTREQLFELRRARTVETPEDWGDAR